MMTILNFSHPIAQEQVDQAFSDDAQVIQVPVNIDMDNTDFTSQVVSIVDSIGWSPEQWQTTPFVVNFAGLATVSVLLVAEIHGRCGHFPEMLMMRRNGSVYEIFAVEDLQAVRDSARRRRF